MHTLIRQSEQDVTFIEFLDEGISPSICVGLEDCLAADVDHIVRFCTQRPK